MFLTFPEDAHWNMERQAVEFGVEIGEYHGVVRVRGTYSNASSRSGPPRGGASRRITCNDPGSRASLSGSCVGAS